LIPSLRLHPAQLTFSTFDRSANVRAGSTFYSVISGSNRSAVAVNAADPGGGVLPSNMQLWVVRMK
jgi:hypothetical protein